MNKDKYQESLNDIIRNYKGFPCKNDSFYNMQELVDNSYIEYLGIEQKNKELQERIDKAIEYIKEKARNNCWIDQYESCDLIKILKEVE